MRAVPVDPNGRAKDIAREVFNATREAIACMSRDGAPSRREAARLCWELLKYHVEYSADNFHQYVRMPWRTLEDRVTDCKSSAVLIASVCERAGCDVVLCFVINPGETHYGHVYALVDGQAADPLLEFGEECTNVGISMVRIDGKA